MLWRAVRHATACRVGAVDVDILRPNDTQPCVAETEDGAPIRERTATRFPMWMTTTKASPNAVYLNGVRERFTAV